MRALAPAVAAALALVGLAGATPAGARTVEDVEVSVEPDETDVLLGETTDIRVTLTNTGNHPTEALVVHIDITDPTSDSSVDPEDWTATLSKPVGVLAPGTSATVGWSIQPISGGSFALYAVALSPGSDRVAASNVLDVTVTDQRSLNPGGILPVALGAPALVGALLMVQMRLARRVPEPPSSNRSAAGQRRG